MCFSARIPPGNLEPVLCEADVKNSSVLKILITHINSYFIASPLHSELVSALDSKGIQQNVFVPVQKANLINKNLPICLQRGKIHYLHCFKTFHRYLWPLKMLKVWRSFKEHFASHPTNLIHAHSLITNGWIAYRANKKWNIPYVVSIRYTDIHIFLEKLPFFRLLALKILRNAEYIVFLSPAYQKVQIKRFFREFDYQMILEKSVVFPNGINQFWINNRERGMLPKNKRRLVFVGSLIKRKNPSALIEACDILNKEGFYVELTVVGDGPLFKKIKNQSLKTKVVFLGKVGEKDKLLEVYKQSDILVVPSHVETFGLVYPEAMSQGLPVIYSKNQGFDGFFQDGHVGFAIHPHSSQDIADKIKQVFADYERISANAFEASKNFSWDVVTNKLVHLYQSIDQF